MARPHRQGASGLQRHDPDRDGADSRELGWDYLGKLGKQRVMQVQSSTEPPKKLAIGERPVMADGNEYNLFTLKESGSPIEIVYPSEGTPFIASPSAVMAKAPNPNAARLLQSFLYRPETQQLLIDAGGLRSLHRRRKSPPAASPCVRLSCSRTMRRRSSTG
jgi:iron(III) transport system substrate-binding protein